MKHTKKWLKITASTLALTGAIATPIALTSCSENGPVDPVNPETGKYQLFYKIVIPNKPIDGANVTQSEMTLTKSDLTANLDGVGFPSFEFGIWNNETNSNETSNFFDNFSTNLKTQISFQNSTLNTGNIQTSIDFNGDYLIRVFSDVNYNFEDELAGKVLNMQLSVEDPLGELSDNNEPNTMIKNFQINFVA